MAVGTAGQGADSEAFWRFSLAFYGEPGVAGALIALQDRDGCDVDLILLALWLAVCGQALDRETLAVAEAAAAPVRDAVVAELRALRRRLRADPDPDIQALRRRIGALEIAAERRVQARLVASLPPRRAAAADRRALPAANLAVCLGPAAAAAEAATLGRAIARFIDRR